MKIQKLDSNIFHIVRNCGIAVLVLGTAILFSACKKNIGQIKAFSSPENLPILEASNFETLRTDSGQINFLLQAPKLLQFEIDGKSFVEFPEGMHLVKYDANKKIISSITADYAKQFKKEGKWEAKNNVVVTNANGDSLKTEHLILDEKSEKIYTEEFVRIIREDQIITGVGLTSDQNMLNWNIKKPRGTIYVSVNKDNQASENNANVVEPEKKPNAAEPPKTIQFK